MKSRIIFLFMAWLTLATTRAATQLSMESMTLKVGQEQLVAVSLSLADGETCVGVQFDLQLPSGVALVTGRDGLVVAPSAVQPSDLQCQMTTTGPDAYRLVVYSSSLRPLKGGTLLSFRMKADNWMAEGYYGMDVSQIALSDADGRVTKQGDFFCYVIVEAAGEDYLAVDFGDGLKMGAGEETEVNISYTSGGTPYVGVQFDVWLPDGISLAANSDGSLCTVAARQADDLTCRAYKNGNLYRVLLFSPSTKELKDGNLLTLRLKTDAWVPSSSDMLEVSNITFSTDEGQVRPLHGIYRPLSVAGDMMEADETATIKPNEEKEWTLSLLKGSEAFVGVQFSLILPMGVTLEKNTEGTLFALGGEQAKDLSCSVIRHDSNIYQFVIFSPSLATLKAADLVTLRLKADADVVAGDEAIRLASIAFSDAEGRVVKIAHYESPLSVVVAADDYLQWGGLTLTTTATPAVTLSFTPTGEAFSGVQFDLALPEGFTLATEADGSTVMAVAKAQAETVKCSVRDMGGGSYRFVAYVTSSDAISDGLLLTLCPQVESWVAGGNYEVGMTAIALANDKGEVRKVTDSSFTLTYDKEASLTWQLDAGWNWVSVNLDETGTLQTFLAPIAAQVEELKSQTQGIVNDRRYGLVGSLARLAPQDGYRIKVGRAVDYTWQGLGAPAKSFPVVLSRGWNWLGYVPLFSLPVEAALAELAPCEGDRLVGFDDFCEYRGGKWQGTLTTMTPGAGYLYYGSGVGTFCYPARQPAVSEASSRSAEGKRNDTPWTYQPHRYPDNQTMILRLMADGAVAEGYQVAAFCGDECRGISQEVEGLLFLTVHGTLSEGETLRFVAYHPASGRTYDIMEEMPFDGQRIGRLTAPDLLTLGHENATAIAAPELTDTPSSAFPAAPVAIYNLAGQRVATDVRRLPEGIYIRGGRKLLVR